MHTHTPMHVAAAPPHPPPIHPPFTHPPTCPQTHSPPRAHPPTPPKDYAFPQRTVLVLGREKEGIPATLLGLLHATVEIPQASVCACVSVRVRSMHCPACVCVAHTVRASSASAAHARTHAQTHPPPNAHTRSWGWCAA